MHINSTNKLFILRLLAFIVDIITISLSALILSQIGVPFFHSSKIHVFSFEINSYVTRIGPILSWFYYSLFECSFMQATPGKYLFKLQVSDTLFQRANFAQTTARHFSKILSFLLLGGGYIMFFFNVNRQCLHDYISSTIVHFKNLKLVNNEQTKNT